MKREHTTQSNSLLDWLKSKNCILYSPLSQNDTTDWISGNQIIPYGEGSMIWDSNQQMWKFSKLASQPYGDTQYFAYWELKETVQQQNWITTGIAELYSDSYTRDSYSCYDSLPTRAGMSLYGTRYSLTQSAQVFSIVSNKSRQQQYRNGSSVFTYNYNTILQFPVTTGIRIGNPMNRTVDETSRSSGPYWLRNFAFFLQAFTLSEINEYFSLI